MAQLTLFESSDWILKDDERGCIAYTPRFIDAATAAVWFAELRVGVSWREMRREMYDREVNVPRLIGHYWLDPPGSDIPPAILDLEPGSLFVMDYVTQKSQHECRIKLLDRQCRGSGLQLFRRETHQQLEGICICVGGLKRSFLAGWEGIRARIPSDGDREASSLTSSIEILSGLGHVTQEFRCGLQIPVGIRDVGVTKISTQRDHMPRNSLTVSPTFLQRPDCNCMAEILNAAAPDPRTTSQAGGAYQI